MSGINPDYFKASKKSETPMADAMARMVNKQLEQLGMDERINVKDAPSPEKKKSNDQASQSGFLV